MDIRDESPNLPPMPYTTKSASKRRKHTFGPKQPGMRIPSTTSMIYRINTDCVVADEATEARLNRQKYTAPDTSTRLAGYNFIWGEVTETPQS